MTTERDNDLEKIRLQGQAMKTKYDSVMARLLAGDLDDLDGIQTEAEATAAFDALMSMPLFNGSTGLTELVTFVAMPGQPCDPRVIAMALLTALEEHMDRDWLTRQILLERLYGYAEHYLRQLAAEAEDDVRRAGQGNESLRRSG